MTRILITNAIILALIYVQGANSFSLLGSTRTRTTRRSVAFEFASFNHRLENTDNRPSLICRKLAATDDKDGPTLKRVSPDLEGIPIPFVDVSGNAFIECFADTVANVDGVEYTIGVPCDYSVALCYYDDDEQLVPIELTDTKLMDDVFPVAESIVAEEFGEELVLQRTPQTLTLVGELEEDEEEFEEDDDLEMGEDDDDDEEEVEVLLSFEHRGREYNLVRLLDPILLVGRVDANTPDNRLLLTAEESAAVMPILEEMFLEFHDDPDAIIP